VSLFAAGDAEARGLLGYDTGSWSLGDQFGESSLATTNC
jgi:hypothetical protein